MMETQVQRVIDQLDAYQQTVSDAWNIPREEAMLLHNIVLAAGCRNLVEVGTSYGFSGLFLAAAARINGGRLHTLDIDPRKHEHAGRNFAQAGLEAFVELHTGDARESLAGLPGGIDFAFLDATKSQTQEYWRLIEPRLADRCLVAVDNTGTHPEQLAPFVEMLRSREDFTSCDVPVGNGFELAVRPGRR